MEKIYSMLHPEDYLDSALEYIEEYDEPEMLDKVDDLAEAMMYDDWNNFYSEVLDRYFNNHMCLAIGSIGRWDGSRHGANIIENAGDFHELLRDCWYIELFDDNGYLTVCGHHHDGQVLFTIKELKDRGIKWYLDHEYDFGWTIPMSIKYLDTNFCSKKPEIEWFL